MSLAEMYEKIASMDQDVEEQYEELNDVEKTAQEYDAAGRIMARGFMDELDKLAQGNDKVPVPRKLFNQIQQQQSSKRSKALSKEHKAIESKHRAVAPRLRRAGQAVSETVGSYGQAARNLGGTISRDARNIFTGQQVK